MPCGIGGVLMLDGDPPPESDLERLSRSLAHRGPDEEGSCVEGPIGLVHRRLSIIDLAGGKQPMRDDEAQLTVVLNGEIYNYLELRAELEASRGHVFRTQSDTEVLLKGYRAWGVDLLKRLVGMFAFALWDARAQRLLLAVDHLGQKPLCYLPRPGKAFWFASEVKGLLAARPGARVSPESLVSYLLLNYVPLPFSLTAGVLRLLPGHYLQVDLQRPDFTPRPYWNVPPAAAGQDALDSRAAAPEWERLLRESVRICLRSDVPLGCLLSGGLDSATVVALAARELGPSVRAFTAGFEGLPDEREWARLTARHLGIAHTELVLKPELEKDLDRFAWMLDEPIGDTSIVPTYYICRAAREHVKVCLTGDGGDELMGGYGYYLEHVAAGAAGQGSGKGFRLASRVWDALPGPLRNRLRRYLMPYRDQLRRKRAAAIRHPRKRHLSLVTHTYDGGVESWLRPEFHAALESWESFAESGPADEPPLDAAARYDLEVNLPGVLLRKTDLASMAVGLELRCPLLDHRLVELSRRLSWDAKLEAGQGKKLLRDLARRWLPEALFSQPKRGFGAPMEQWLRTREMEAAVRGLLLDARSRRCTEFLAPEPLEELVRDFYNRRGQASQKVWTFLVFEKWLRRYGQRS
jgi:asparagine synthase (glutamine-hydrolysing)